MIQFDSIQPQEQTMGKQRKAAFGSRTRRLRKNQRRTSALRIERLEDRKLLTVYTITGTINYENVAAPADIVVNQYTTAMFPVRGATVNIKDTAGVLVVPVT